MRKSSPNFPRLKLMAALGVNLIFCLPAAKGEGFSPLKKATVEELSGDVTIRKEMDATNRKAVLKDVVSGKDVIHTGKKSRTELEFADRSLCRLGSNTVFSFDPTSRNMAVSQGVAVVHVPPGNGGARIATPAATAAISGDTLICACFRMPDGNWAAKFMALSPHGGPTQGNIIITLANNPGVSIPLGAGQVAVVPQNATSRMQVPVVEIDIGKFTAKTPMLQNLPPAALQEIKTIMTTQAQGFASGAIIPTQFAMMGNGDQLVNLAAPPPNGFPPPPPGTTPTGMAPAPGSMPPPNGLIPTGTLTSPTGTLVYDPTTGTYVSTTTFTTTTSPNQPLSLTGGSGTLVYNSIIYLPPPGVIPGTNLALPPPGVLNFYFGGTGGQFSLVNATIDTMAGTINGMGPSPTTFGYSAATPGLGLFGFDKLTLSGTISVTGGNELGLHTFNNSGASTAGNAITIGSTTFSFAANTPNAVHMVARGNGGDIVINGNLTAPSAAVNLLAPIPVAGGPTPPPTSGNITMNTGTTLNVSGAGGGSVNVMTANNATLQTINANETSGAVGATAGNISVSSSGTVNLQGALNANGTGSSGGGGISISGSSLNPSTAFVASANGGAPPNSPGAPGGPGGSISLCGGSSAVSLVGGNSLQAIGGNANGIGGLPRNPGGAGGFVSVNGGSVTMPTGTSIQVSGGYGYGPYQGGNGGSVNLTSQSTISIATATSAGNVINATPGGSSPFGMGGNISLSAPTSVTVNATTTQSAPTINAGTGGAINHPQAPVSYTGMATHNP